MDHGIQLNKLQFRQVAPGLGFKSPQKEQSKSGLGAQAAGRVSFRYLSNHRKADSMLNITEQVSVNNLGIKSKSDSVQKILPRLFTSTGPKKETSTIFDERWIYLGKRVAAFVGDTAILFAFSGIVLTLASIQFGISSSYLFSKEALLLLTLFTGVFSWAVQTAQEVAFGSTLSKTALGLSVEGDPLAVLIRSVLFLAGLLFFGIGIAYALFDKKGRCIHDLLTGIQPKEFAEL